MGGRAEQLSEKACEKSKTVLKTVEKIVETPVFSCKTGWRMWKSMRPNVENS